MNEHTAKDEPTKNSTHDDIALAFARLGGASVYGRK
jgi:hypothetical protein